MTKRTGCPSKRKSKTALFYALVEFVITPFIDDINDDQDIGSHPKTQSKDIDCGVGFLSAHNPPGGKEIVF